MDEMKEKILVVDDDPMLLELLVETLKSFNYNVVQASDGIEALEVLSQQKFNLLISDIKMPNLDGIGLLNEVRKQYPELPVLFITGVNAPEIIGRATPDGFLTKPFRINRIEDLIEKTLNRNSLTALKIKSILVVDDDQLFRDMLIDTLQYNDYTPIPASDGEAALTQLKQGNIEAVITDLKMPGMDGLSLMKQIRKYDPNIPVIITSAFFNDDETKQTIADSNPDGILAKPFTVDTVLKILNNLNNTPLS